VRLRRAAKRLTHLALGDRGYRRLEARYWRLRLQRRNYPYERLATLERVISPGDTVVDVGANVGQYSVLFSRLVGPQGRVIAFEPVPRTHDVLRSVVAGPGLANVELVRAALADFDGQSDVVEVLDRDGLPDPGLAHLALQSPGTVEVRVARLDALRDELAIDSCSFVKIDVEGAELLVLRGAREFLQAHRPVLMVELDRGMSARFKASPEEVLGFLQDLGYRPEMASGSWEGPSTVFFPSG
jgi:FkbM family methyltransferase